MSLYMFSGGSRWHIAVEFRNIQRVDSSAAPSSRKEAMTGLKEV